MIAIEARTEPETEAEAETKEPADQGIAMVDTEQSLESYISIIEESIKEERDRNEKLKERIREIKEKIDSLQ